jgi:sarcosine oxidase, subunit beta
MKPGGPRVCVVGAGAIGLCAALSLARRGAGEVTVLEARHPAAGSSGLSAGIIETQYLDPLDVELRVRSMRFFARLERDHGLQIVRNGYLRLGHEPQARGAFERSVEIQRSLGVADAQALGREQVAKLVPDMRVEDVHAGLYGPSDGFLDGHLYCALLAELAQRHGARLLAARSLVGAERRDGGWTLQLAGGRGHGDGRLDAGRRLEAGGERLDCDAVVDAAGPWSAQVAALLGCELALVPLRQQAALVHLPRTLAYTMPSVMDYTPGSGECGLYFRHEGPGRLIAGLHVEGALAASSDPDDYARSADAEFLEELARRLSDRLPGLADARLGAGWAGLYPMSSSGRPLVGPLDAAGTVLVALAGGSGIQLSPTLGELVADWALDGAPRSLADAVALRP